MLISVQASERGVLLFNDQDITPAELKRLVIKLGKLTGNPPEAGLHRHAFAAQNNSHLGIPEVEDPDILTISSVVSALHTAFMVRDMC